VIAMPNTQEAHLAAITTVTGLPAVVTTIDHDGGRRMSVFGADRVEICGAFKPVDRSYWLMYVTKRIADAVERSQATLIPRRIQLPTQQDVRQWLELIAGLYLRGANQ
jgi:hypothetical protein